MNKGLKNQSKTRIDNDTLLELVSIIYSAINSLEDLIIAQIEFNDSLSEIIKERNKNLPRK